MSKSLLSENGIIIKETVNILNSVCNPSSNWDVPWLSADSWKWKFCFCNFFTGTSQDHLGSSPKTIGSTWIGQKGPLLAPWSFEGFWSKKILYSHFCSSSAIWPPILAWSISNRPKFFFPQYIFRKKNLFFCTSGVCHFFRTICPVDLRYSKPKSEAKWPS